LYRVISRARYLHFGWKNRGIPAGVVWCNTMACWSLLRSGEFRRGGFLILRLPRVFEGQRTNDKGQRTEYEGPAAAGRLRGIAKCKLQISNWGRRRPAAARYPPRWVNAGAGCGGTQERNVFRVKHGCGGWGVSFFLSNEKTRKRQRNSADDCRLWRRMSLAGKCFGGVVYSYRSASYGTNRRDSDEFGVRSSECGMTDKYRRRRTRRGAQAASKDQGQTASGQGPGNCKVQIANFKLGTAKDTARGQGPAAGALLNLAGLGRKRSGISGWRGRSAEGIILD
jgi:hypothetical protein